MTTYLNLVNAVLERTGQETVSTLTNATSPVTQTMAFLNEVYTEMTMIIAPQFFTARTAFNTQSTVALYNPVSNTDVSRVFKDQIFNATTGQRLFEIAPGILESQDSIASGTPTRFWFESGQIRLYPIPDGIYNITYRYLIHPTPLVNDGDTLIFPPDWQMVLIRGSQSLLEKFLGELENGRTSYLMYLEGMMLLKTREKANYRSTMRGYYPYGSNPYRRTEP